MSQANLRTSTLKRKASQNLTFAAKRAKKVSCKKLISIFQKKEEDRTPNEKQLILESSESIGALRQRLKRINEVKTRNEEIEDNPDVLAEKCKELANAIRNARHVVVYTGAGISTAAKIPDYRGTKGIWTLLQQGKDIGNHDLSLAEPTLTHMALYKLYRHGLVNHVVSQNCDNLHLRSGLPRRVLSEVHGNMSVEVCAHCEPVRYYWRVFDVTEHTARYAHQTARKCSCGEPLLDTIIHFGEKGVLLWPLNWNGANQNAEKADLILCVGSSLKVLRKYCWLWGLDRPKRDRPKLMIVNLQWTPKDDQATLKINGKCDAVFEQVMSHLNLEIPVYDKLRDPIFYHSSHLIQPEFHTVRKPMLDLPGPEYFGKYENFQHILDSFRQLENYQNTTVFLKEEYDEEKVKDENEDGFKIKEEQNEDDLKNSKRKRSSVKVEQDDEDVGVKLEDLREDEKMKKEETETIKTEMCLKSKIKQELNVGNPTFGKNTDYLSHVISDEQNVAHTLRANQQSKVDRVENVHCESNVSFNRTKCVLVQETSRPLNKSPVQNSHSECERSEQLRPKPDDNELEIGNKFTKGTIPNILKSSDQKDADLDSDRSGVTSTIPHEIVETKTSTSSTNSERSDIKSILKNFRRVKKSDKHSSNLGDSTALDGSVKTTPSTSDTDSDRITTEKCTIKGWMQVEKQASNEGQMSVEGKANSSPASITSTSTLNLPSVTSTTAVLTNPTDESNLELSKGSFSTLVSSLKGHVKCACRSEMDLTRSADASTRSNMACSCANYDSDPTREAVIASKDVNASKPSIELSGASPDTLSQEKTPRYGSLLKGSVVGIVKPFQKVVDTPTAADSSNINHCPPVQCDNFIGQSFINTPSSDKTGLVTTSVFNSQQTGPQPIVGNPLPLVSPVVSDPQISMNSIQPLPLSQSFISPPQMFSIIPSNSEAFQQPVLQPPAQLVPQIQPFIPVSQQQQLLQPSAQQQQSFPQPLLPLLMNSPGFLPPQFSLLQPQFLTGMPMGSIPGGAFQILSTDMTSFPNQNSVIYLQPFPIAAQQMPCMPQQIGPSCMPQQMSPCLPQQISPNLLLVPPSNSSVNTIPFSLNSTSTPLSSTNPASNFSTDSYCSPSNTMFPSQPILNSVQPLSQPSLISIQPDQLLNTMPIVSQNQVLNTLPIVSQNQVLNTMPVASQNQVLNTMPVASQNQVLNTMPVASQNQVLNTMPVASQNYVLNVDSQPLRSNVQVMDTGQMITPVSNTVIGLTTNMSVPSNTLVGPATNSSLASSTIMGPTNNPPLLSNTVPAASLTPTPILATNIIPVTPIIGTSAPMVSTNNTQMVPKLPLLSSNTSILTPSSSISSSVANSAFSMSPNNSHGNKSVTTSNDPLVYSVHNIMSSNNSNSVTTDITSNVSTAVKTSNGEISNASASTEMCSIVPNPSSVSSISPVKQNPSQPPIQGNSNTSPVSNPMSPRVIIRSPNSLTVRSPLMRSPLTPVVSPLKRIRTIRPFQFKDKASPPEDLIYCSSQNENNSGTRETKGATDHQDSIDNKFPLVKPRALVSFESASNQIAPADRTVETNLKEGHCESATEDEKSPVEQVDAEKKKRGRKANPNKEEKEEEIYHYSLPQACEFCLQNYQSEVCLFYERQSTLTSTGRRKIVCNCCADRKSVEENVAVLPSGNPGWFGKGYKKGMRKKRSSV